MSHETCILGTCRTRRARRSKTDDVQVLRGRGRTATVGVARHKIQDNHVWSEESLASSPSAVSCLGHSPCLCRLASPVWLRTTRTSYSARTDPASIFSFFWSPSFPSFVLLHMGEPSPRPPSCSLSVPLRRRQVFLVNKSRGRRAFRGQPAAAHKLWRRPAEAHPGATAIGGPLGEVRRGSFCSTVTSRDSYELGLCV